MKKNALHFLNISVFLQSQIFMLPVLLLFYQHNGLSTGDFFLFQGIFSLTCLLLEVPAGYLSDLFSRKSILILSYSLFIARLLLWLFWANLGYWIILAGEILYAAQKATFSGASDSYVYEYLKTTGTAHRMLKRYGKMNFSMSVGTAISSLLGAVCYQAVSQWSRRVYHYDYGFTVLIIMELILNGLALYFLCRLPKLSSVKRSRISPRDLCLEFFGIINQTCRNKLWRYHIIFAGLMAATTMVLVWSFQPIMEALFVPVSAYGVVYFINHLCRAGAALKLDRIRRMFSLTTLGTLTFIGFTIDFCITFLILKVQPLPLIVNLIYFCWLSGTIGIQLAFNLSHIRRLHQLADSSVRGTVSSINMAVSRLCSGLCLIMLKFVMEGRTVQVSLGAYFIVFLIGIIPLVQVYRISLRNNPAT